MNEESMISIARLLFFNDYHGVQCRNTEDESQSDMGVVQSLH